MNRRHSRQRPLTLAARAGGAIPLPKRRAAARSARDGRRALILPVVLIVITFLALLSASFSFQVNAHRAGVQVVEDRVQLREAAESGIHHVLLVLREGLHDTALWYDNEDLFRNRVVWSSLGDWADIDVPDAIEPGSVTYRYSLVADDPDNDLNGVRYGITDESSKLNINAASGRQLRRLFEQVVPEEVDPAPLVDALIDWRDGDNEPRPQGAEQEHYLLLEPPYTVKNGPFETVEELLLVKGFSARILFGEDYDRNGLLEKGEDNGQHSFPPDNEDGQLDRGLYPYITVYSRDYNRSNDNVPRADLNGDAEKLREVLEELVPEEVLDYISRARAGGVSFGSPIELLGHSFTPAGGGGPGEGDPPPTGEGAGSDPTGDGSADSGGGAGGGGGEGGGGAAAAETSPVTPQDLPVLCDRTTAVRRPDAPGVININTAPREVLLCLVNDVFTAVDVDAILAAREQLTGEQLAFVSWPVTEGLVAVEALASIYAVITARGQQFTLQAVGHADHIGQMVRIQAVVELRGQVPQHLYYRDITELGTHFPIRGGGENFVQNRTR